MSSLRQLIISIFISSLLISVEFIKFASANPSINANSKRLDVYGGFDILGICLKNCAQCKKMFGSFFEGHRCADNCVKFKGKNIPDCENLESISPYLNTKI